VKAEPPENCCHGRSRVGVHGRGQGRGRGRGRNDGQRQSKEYGNIKKDVQCYHCRRYAHMQADCWFKDQKMNFVVEDEEENNLFMACLDTNHKPGNFWFVDSGCSNHITGNKFLFKELDEKQHTNMKLDNNREKQVKGKRHSRC